MKKTGGAGLQDATGDPPSPVQNECESLQLDHQSVLMNDHFIGRQL